MPTHVQAVPAVATSVCPWLVPTPMLAAATRPTRLLIATAPTKTEPEYHWDPSHSRPPL